MITRQAKALGISRGSVYYLPRPVPPADLAVMRRIDELHLEFPFAGSRMLRDLLNREGIEIGRRHVATPMQRMRIEALYRKPNTSRPAPGRMIYPYLVRGVTVDHLNHRELAARWRPIPDKKDHLRPLAAVARQRDNAVSGHNAQQLKHLLLIPPSMARSLTPILPLT